MEKYRKILLLSLKIGIGGSAAIYIAQFLQLDHAISAGTVTLLTLMASKWETIKLAVCRLVTFVTTLVMAWILFSFVDSIWLVYGILLTTVVFMAEFLGWRATISVNAVISAHLVTDHNFSWAAIRNEYYLVMIGIIIAVFLNLFNDNLTHKKKIIANMRHTESKLQMIMKELAAYLLKEEMSRSVWEDICNLDEQIQKFIRDAEEYQNNTFQSHPEYYINYFKMRHEQCRILDDLHYEMKKIRGMPKQARVVAEYILYLTNFVIEIYNPVKQMERMKEIFRELRSEELPVTEEEFESRVMLYHILMDIEDFLACKARFVQKLDKKQLQIYWKKDYN